MRNVRAEHLAQGSKVSALSNADRISESRRRCSESTAEREQSMEFCNQNGCIRPRQRRWSRCPCAEKQLATAPTWATRFEDLEADIAALTPKNGAAPAKSHHHQQAGLSGRCRPSHAARFCMALVDCIDVASCCPTPTSRKGIRGGRVRHPKAQRCSMSGDVAAIKSTHISVVPGSPRLADHANLEDKAKPRLRTFLYRGR